MPLAYSYIRFSTPRQAEGDSLRRQIAATEEWCKANDYQLVDSYQDLGVSARKGKNADKGRLADFLAAVKSKAISKGSALIVERLDRLSRDAVEDALSLLLDIIRSGISVVTVHDGRVYTKGKVDTTALIIAVIELSAAHAANEARIKRVEEACKTQREKIRGGEILPGRCPGWCRYDGDKKKYIPILEKVKVVMRLYRETKNGKAMARIVADLNAEKVPTLRGEENFKKPTRWTKETVRHHLRSICVLGHKKPGEHVGKYDGEVVKYYYPQIIDDKLYNDVQAILDTRSKPRRKPTGEVVNILTGLLICSACGHPVHRFDVNDRVPGVKCFEPGCEVKSHIDHRSLEQSILALLRDHILDSDFNADGSADKRKELTEKLEALEVKEKELSEKVDYLVALGAEKGVSAKRTASRIIKVEEELDGVEGKIEDLKKELVTVDRESKSAINNAESVREIVLKYKDNNDARARVANALRRIIDKIIIDARNQQVHVHLKGSGVVHSLTPLSVRYLYVEDMEPVEALQIIETEDGGTDNVDTELIGGNIVVDRQPVDEQVHVRPQIEHMSNGKVLIHPRRAAVPRYEMLSPTEAAEVSSYSSTRIMQLCRAGRIAGAYQGVDKRWQIPLWGVKEITQ
jgi:DNA invertase Pin-like site-specific DNA recombinase/ribosomal protein L17